jgi:hypothetical protein
MAKYRDATYSDETQEKLRALLARLTSQDGWLFGDRGDEIRALTTVVERWDANEATEVDESVMSLLGGQTTNYGPERDGAAESLDVVDDA